MKKIVVVDDFKMLLKEMKDFIEFKTEFKCVTFSNSEEALQYILAEKDIYAVITDYEMPQMTGFELVKHVIDKLPETKTIVMSGHDTAYLKKCAAKNGINKNKVSLISKSDIVNIALLLNS